MRARLLWIGCAVLVVAVVAVGTILLVGGRDAAREDDRILIVIDAGHGGRDPGAVCDDVKEADVNLAIARRIAERIEADERLDVETTRAIDITVSLEDRIAVANEGRATAYLSIQSNACAYPEATGVVSLVSDRLPPDDRSWQLAEILQDAVTDATGARDRGVRSQDLYLHRAEMPAVLIEVGFLTNDGERAKLLDPAYQQTIAQGIYDGLLRYLQHTDPTFGP